MSGSTPQRDASPLPPERAFVVQFHAGGTASTAPLGGRVEHIVSGRAERFASIDELLAFVRATLAAVPAPRDPAS